MSDRGSLLLRLANRDIDSLTLNLGAEKMVLLNAPKSIRHVLTGNAKNYAKQTPTNAYFAEYVADGLITEDGERWARDRALLAPTFRDVGRLAAFAHKCVQSTSDMLDGYAASGAQVNLAGMMAQLTLAIATETMFGLPHEPFLELCIETGVLLDESTSMLPDEKSRAAVVRRALLDAVRAQVDAMSTPPGPVLAALLADPHHQKGEALTNQALSLLLAGFETTANSLAWAWILLMRHPEVYARLQAGLDGDDDADGIAFARAVVEESLRLYPAAWIIGRRAIGNDHVGGVDIAADTSILISPYLVQRHPRWWTDAGEYRPERFLPGGQRPTDRYAYIPFGAGPRFCLGSVYALEEAVIIISTLAKRFTFQTPMDLDAARPELKFVLRAPDPLTVTVHRRDNGN